MNAGHSALICCNPRGGGHILLTGKP
ncbi:hypothetical protein PQZ66_gp01 [Klebsiella phage vB_KleM_KB2]|nr:hypothetical protein PQZ66_gp01 [Klebsiella phage vB_KleM_KB2]